LNSFLKSLKISEETGDQKGISASHANIGNIYARQANRKKHLKSNLFFKNRRKIGDQKVLQPLILT